MKPKSLEKAHDTSVLGEKGNLKNLLLYNFLIICKYN